MSAEWSITSPMALLSRVAGPGATGDLQDLVLLGFTVNLPFLEKVAIRTARDLGARVTVIGDAAHGVYDPVDVRLRSYFTGLGRLPRRVSPQAGAADRRARHRRRDRIRQPDHGGLGPQRRTVDRPAQRT